MSTPNEPKPTDPADQAARALVRVVPAIYSLSRSMISSRFPQLKGFPQLRILLRLAKAPALTLKELAEREGVTPPTMSKAVDNLVEKGWATRATADDDRRSVQLTLTRAGAELAHQVGEDLCKQLAARLGVLDDRGLSVLIEAMELLESAGILGSGLEGEVPHA